MCSLVSIFMEFTRDKFTRLIITQPTPKLSMSQSITLISHVSIGTGDRHRQCQAPSHRHTHYTPADETIQSMTAMITNWLLYAAWCLAGPGWSTNAQLISCVCTKLLGHGKTRLAWDSSRLWSPLDVLQALKFESNAVSLTCCATVTPGLQAAGQFNCKPTDPANYWYLC